MTETPSRSCACCGCWNDHDGLCAACWTHQRDGLPCDQRSRRERAVSRLSNRDVDGLIHDQYEDALADGEQWAEEALAVRQWAALDGKKVQVRCIDGITATGTWEWHGPRGEDFYLVYINAPDGSVILGTDPRNFSEVRAHNERAVQAENPHHFDGYPATEFRGNIDLPSTPEDEL